MMKNCIIMPEAEGILTGGKSIKIIEGVQVISLLLDNNFREAWEKLHNCCPWSTVYQSFDFVQAWYSIYHKKHLPILVFGLEKGGLTGLIPLVKLKNNEIHGAGGFQAEYQTWLSTERHNTEFMQSSLHAIQNKYPGHSLNFKYIPDQTPLKWIEKSDFKNNCWTKPYQHPIMRIDKDVMDKELRKKNKKEKINRLKRLGEINFDRISDYEEFTSVFDEIANHNDFRKGALYNVNYFQKTNLAKEFLLALFNKGLLHVTILKVGSEIIAANVGTIGNSWVHLQGINAHSPQYVKYSPGILHFLMLGRHMAGEGFEVFDLTPGADAYKDTLATEYREAYQFTFASRSKIVSAKIKNYLNLKLKSVFFKIGVDVKNQRKLKNKFLLVNEKIKILKSEGVTLLWKDRAFVNNLKEPNNQVKINFLTESVKNPKGKFSERSIEDLLKYKPGGSLYTRWEFMEDALKRLELGLIPYTLIYNNELLCCIWVDNSEINKIIGSNEKDNSAKIVLSGLYFHSNGEGLVSGFLSQVYKELIKRDTNINVVLAASNKATRKYIKTSNLF